MKLVTFLQAGTEKIGAVVADGRILDFAAAEPRLAVDMLTLIRRQDELMPHVRALASAPPATALVDPARIHLLAPIPRPVSMRDGYAFRQHVATARRNRGLEMIPEFDLFPVTYFTNHLAVTGPGEVLVQDHHLTRLDFELEVAIVTGRPLKNATLEEADAAIFGYMVMNDWSARMLQMEEMKLSLGPCKGKDFATSLGPWLVTKDELKLERTPKGEILHAAMTCDVNGHRLSNGNADSMNWTFAQILQRTSYGIQMQAGEVIGSGTVGTGCLLELNGSKVTDNLWLKAGDEVVMDIEGLGRLVNTIVHAPERLEGMPPHLVGGVLPDLYAGTPAGEAGD
ncbi:MAG: fumarylacetoacetate hydrolase family protein [Geothrix sp.]|uniref:fumarylacetoacetate hydrolase family protein n=1 Tax=Geothrix sp. TaxID=1962974 RepID=UPI00184F0AF2|nr:fumarylacetoacetate hydrolase family protein [Geothrix sp.]NWJ40725.1 fumarylacetoacetate hydrolase family protein [Geothrix sp.]WIL21269.1 MAG: fumarylacetoacetate hydrolase family protein [Geothrix sp.]